MQIDPWPATPNEFSGLVAGRSFRGLKSWQAGADEIGEIRGITRLYGSFVNQGPGFKFRKRQVTRQGMTLIEHLITKAVQQHTPVPGLAQGAGR